MSLQEGSAVSEIVMSGSTSMPRRLQDGFNAVEWSVIGGVFVVSSVVALVIVATQGNLFAGVAPVLALGLVCITIYRLEWSFFLLVGLVLLFDQFHIPGFEPLTFKLRYFVNLKEHPYLPHLDAGVANLVELHIALLVLVWFMVFSARRPETMVPVPVWGSLLLFLAMLGSSFAYGMKNAGEPLVALWEVRALAYLGFFYWFVPQVVRSKRHVEILLWIIVAAISFKAFQGVGRFALLGFSFRGFPTLTNHEDPVFITTLLVFLLGLILFRVRHIQRTALVWLLLPLLLGFVTGQRRTAYAGLAMTLVVFVIALPKQERWALLRIILPALLVGVLYCAVLWNSESKWASPVRLVKSGLADDKEEAGERYYSNLYREFENYDLAFTHRRVPLLGTGFGVKYDMPIPLADIPFPLRDYIPHNQIFWLIVKTGAIGYFCFWLFLNAFAFRGMWTLGRLRDPYFKALCVMIVVAIVNQVVASYYDLQLTFYRNMVYLGTLLGLLGAMEEIERNTQRGGE